MRLELIDSFSPRVEAIWRAWSSARSRLLPDLGWMENWLACLPKREAPKLAVVVGDGEPVAACFLGDGACGAGFVPSRAVFMNATGTRGRRRAVSSTTRCSAPGRVLRPATLVPVFPAAGTSCTCPPSMETFASLTRRPLGSGFAYGRSRSRQLPRRSREGSRAGLHAAARQLDARPGPQGAARRRQVTLEVASAVEPSERYLQRDRHAPSAVVARARPDRRVRRSVVRSVSSPADRQRFTHGDIQFMRLRIRRNDAWLSLQLRLGEARAVLPVRLWVPGDRHVKPGYLCHTQAIEHSAKPGHDIYDLLGGDARYKKSLATDETRLVWGRVQKTRLRFVLEDLARGWMRKRRGKKPDNGARDGIVPPARATTSRASPDLRSARDRSSS